MQGNPGRNVGQEAEQQLEIGFQSENRDSAQGVEALERSALDHLEVVQFQCLDGESADGLHRGQHLRL